MKRKTAIKKLMGYGISRNEANKRLTEAHFLGLSNCVAIFFSYFMAQEYIPNSVLYDIDKVYSISKKAGILND